MNNKFLFTLCFIFCSIMVQANDPIKVLIVTGQNSAHNWAASYPILQNYLNESGLFSADVAISPKRGEDMSGFAPNFSAYQAVVLDYEGDSWSDATKTAFLDYVKKGGGVVVYHSANNSFPKWKEYNEIIGLGGWGGRNEKDGPYVYFKDGKEVRDKSPGHGGSHGDAHEFTIDVRNAEHPITNGLPASWWHAKDELYDRLRGPALNMNVLATAYSDKSNGGTGRDEPVLMTINWGKGRIFHTVLGHVGDNELLPQSMISSSFVVTFLRGTEWAATGKVTQKVPADFPKTDKMSMFENTAASVTGVSVLIVVSKSYDQTITVFSDGTIQAINKQFDSDSKDASSFTDLGKFYDLIAIINAVKEIDKLYQGKCYMVRKLLIDKSCVQLFHKPCP